MVRKIWRFNPQDLANTAWAFAKLEVKYSEQLLHSVRHAVIWKIWELNPQSLANIVWAVARLAEKESQPLESGSLPSSGRSASSTRWT